MNPPLTREELEAYVSELSEDTDQLAHYGVPGMKWGKRKAAAISRNASLNKASRHKDRDQRRSEIDAARERVKSGAPKKAVAEAKAKYQQDKIARGSREAKKALNKVKNDAQKDYEKSKELRDGKEVAIAVGIEVAKAIIISR